MEQLLQQILKQSTELYSFLESPTKGENRTQYIERINTLLDERGILIEQLTERNFVFDATNATHRMIAELNKAIDQRLSKVLLDIKVDLKNLQVSKKNEQQYVTPYSNVQVMDGMYYDKKK